MAPLVQYSLYSSTDRQRNILSRKLTKKCHLDSAISFWLNYATNPDILDIYYKSNGKYMTYTLQVCKSDSPQKLSSIKLNLVSNVDCIRNAKKEIYFPLMLEEDDERKIATMSAQIAKFMMQDKLESCFKEFINTNVGFAAKI